MRITLFLIVFIFTFTITLVNAENSVARKKGNHGNYGLHGIIYKSGLMSVVTFLAIKAKVIIIITVAFTIFILGAKVWATFKYGNLLFDKGCHSHSHSGHDEVIVPHPFPPSSYGYGHDHDTSPEFEGLTPGPGYGYEKYGIGR